jgi:pSer/pThr/pTyr-binding forkhead associated (FHA) protein
MSWQLVVDRGMHKGRRIPLTSSSVWIGRAADCHIRPTSKRVSRHHCVLHRVGGRLVVSTCPSANPTLVNGEPVANQRELRAGDCLTVGPLGFVVELAVAAPVAAGVRESPDEDAAAALLLELDGAEADASADSRIVNSDTIAEGLRSALAETQTGRQPRDRRG